MKVAKLYSQAVTAKTKEMDKVSQPNVNKQVEASVFGNLLYTFVVPLLFKTHSVDQLDIQDIPLPQAWLRSQNILRTSECVNDSGGVQSLGGPTLSLFWTVWGPQWRVVLADILDDAG